MPSDLRKVCIVGFSYTTRDDAPYGDDTFEFWGCNNVYKILPDVKWNRWFEMHQLAHIKDKSEEFPEHIPWLKELTVPLYMQEHYDEFPASVEYPLGLIQAEMLADWKFEPNEMNYIESTIAQEMALALHERVDEIHIYGVDMVIQEEYGYQRPNLEAWIMAARNQTALNGGTVKVVIPEKSALMQGPVEPVYGYRMESQALPDMFLGTMSKRLKAHHEEVDKAAEELEKAKRQYWIQIGGREECEWTAKRTQDLNRGVKG